GPYRLLGNCNGGLVALEMARRLGGEGGGVEHGFGIRTSAQNARFGPAWGGVERWGRLLGVARAAGGGPVRRWVWVCRAWSVATRADRARLVGAKLRRLARLEARSVPPPAHAGAPSDRDSLIGTFGEAAADYVPLPYEGKVVVFWPDEEPEPASDALR